MKLLLDTHTFIWWVNEPSNLSSDAINLCKDKSNILILSVVSAWEIQIKSQLGKIKLSLPLKDIIESQQRVNNLQVLSVGLSHILALDSLPSHHKDPFD